MMRVLNVFLCFFLFLSYFIFSSIAVLLMIVIRFFLSIYKPWQTRFTLFIKELWLALTVTILGVFFIHPTHICFDKKVFTKKRCIVLSNHLTNYDWIYVLVILNKLGMYREVTIILKESLKNLPIYGYGMRVFGYIFLERKWNVDQEILKRGLKQLKEKNSFYLLIFPEGTIIDSETHKKSKKFCTTNNITIHNKPFNPENVILPRKTGYDMIFDNLKDKIDGIIDITLITNPYTKYPSEIYDAKDVFVKRSCNVNFSALIEVYDTADVQKKDWLYELYKEKDELLSEYKDNKKAVKDLHDYKKMCSKYTRNEFKNYGFDTVYIWSDASKFYYLTLFLLIVGVVYCIKK